MQGSRSGGKWCEVFTSNGLTVKATTFSSFNAKSDVFVLDAAGELIFKLPEGTTVNNVEIYQAQQGNKK